VSAASDIAAARIVRTNAEGFRADVYDDATGQPIVCQGQPTVGYGCRVRQWSPALAQVVLSFQLADEYETPLLQYPWYVGCSDVRRSALLEIAFNQGISGLVGGYPSMIAAIGAEDWAQAQAQCTVENVNVKPRYARLGLILLTGVDA
jgi:GH24 family phage-related lysozyme (muramidase)